MSSLDSTSGDERCFEAAAPSLRREPADAEAGALDSGAEAGDCVCRTPSTRSAVRASDAGRADTAPVLTGPAAGADIAAHATVVHVGLEVRATAAAAGRRGGRAAHALAEVGMRRRRRRPARPAGAEPVQSIGSAEAPRVTWEVGMAPVGAQLRTLMPGRPRRATRRAAAGYRRGGGGQGSRRSRATEQGAGQPGPKRLHEGAAVGALTQCPG